LLACIAALSENLDDEYVKEYLASARDQSAPTQMHKVVLEATNENKLLAIAKKLEEAHISHRVWVWRCATALIRF
jgi:peptidyl-tRNA hydrolase